MNIDPLVFFDLVVAVFILATAIGVIALSFGRMVRKFNSYQKEADYIMEKIHKEESDLLEEARLKATKIIEGADEKAAQVINKGEILNSDSKRRLEEALEILIKHQTAYFEKASEDFLKTYKEQLNSLKEKNIQILTNASKDIEVHSLKEVKDFDTVLEKETVDSQKIIESKIEQEYARVQKEVEDYKNQMLKKADEQIYRIIKEVSKTVIGKSLSLEEHEEFIIDALNKAKREALFGK